MNKPTTCTVVKVLQRDLSSPRSCSKASQTDYIEKASPSYCPFISGLTLKFWQLKLQFISSIVSHMQYEIIWCRTCKSKSTKYTCEKEIKSTLSSTNKWFLNKVGLVHSALRRHEPTACDRVSALGVPVCDNIFRQISQVNIYFRCSVISLWPLGHVHLGHHNSLSLICWGWSGQNLFLMMSCCWFFRLKEWRNEEEVSRQERKWKTSEKDYPCDMTALSASFIQICQIWC